jgi:hypothetical protein
VNDFGGDHGDMARAYYGTTRQDARDAAANDLDALYRQNVVMREGLEAVLSALGDAGMDNSHAHQLASQALKAAA